MKVRRPIDVVRPFAAQLVDHFWSLGLVCEVGGSLRRECATVGDLDIVVRCANLQQIVLPDWILFHRLGAQVAQGGVVLGDGSELTVDVWAATEKQWGAFLWYITGSKELNVKMRRMASDQGLKLSQFGLFDGDVQVDDGTEEGVASVLGMAWVDPIERSDGVRRGVSRSFVVPSSSGDGCYTVQETDGGWVCDCGHHRYQKAVCKHIKSVCV